MSTRSIAAASFMLLAGFALGCGSGTAAGEGGGGTGGAEEVPPEPCPDAGQCRATNCGLAYSSSEPCAFEFSCDLPAPCERVDFMVHEQSPGEEPDPEVSLLTPETVSCVLEALRDGTEGTYEWYVTRLPHGQYTTTTWVHVRPDRVALLEWRSQYDLSSWQGFVGPTPLADPGHFEACLEETDPEALGACFAAATADCAP